MQQRGYIGKSKKSLQDFCQISLFFTASLNQNGQLLSLLCRLTPTHTPAPTPTESPHQKLHLFSQITCTSGIQIFPNPKHLPMPFNCAPFHGTQPLILQGYSYFPMLLVTCFCKALKIPKTIPF